MKLFPYQNHVHWVFIGFPMVFPNDFANVLWFFLWQKWWLRLYYDCLWFFGAPSRQSPRKTLSSKVCSCFCGSVSQTRHVWSQLRNSNDKKPYGSIRLQVANDLPWFATSHQHQNISKYSKIGLKQSKTCFFYCCFMPFHHFFGGVLMFLDVSGCFRAMQSLSLWKGWFLECRQVAMPRLIHQLRHSKGPKRWFLLVNMLSDFLLVICDLSIFRVTCECCV